MATIKEKIKQIRKSYKLVTSYKFFYNKKSELKQKSKQIKVWFLIHDREYGYSISTFAFWNKKPLSPPQWATYIRSKGYSVFTNIILAAMNQKQNKNWIFKSLIGYAHDIRYIEDTAISKKGHKKK